MKKVIGVILILCLFILPLGRLAKISAATDSQGIHKNIYNNNPEASATAEGLEFYTLVEGTNRVNGEVERSSKAGIDIGPDMLDVEKLQDIKEIAELVNLGSESKNVNFVWILPKYNKVYSNTNAVVSAEVSVSGNNNLKVRYSAVGGKYLDKDKYLAKYSWNDLIAMQISGNIAPNESIKLTAPLSVPKENTSFSAEIMMFAPEWKTWSINLSQSEFVADLDEYMYGRFAGAYRVTENGRNVYKQVPKEIQSLLPEVRKNDFLYSRWRNLYKEGIQADFEALADSEENKIYTNSSFLIKTERIFEAVKDNGYSVMADNIRGLWNSYAYSPTSGLVFTDDGGNVVELGEEDANGILLSNYYVELHKILDTKDIIIHVGDAWEDYDNLIYKKDIYPRGGGASRELELYEIGVEHNVDNMRVGEYRVKYSYEVAGGAVVTKTAKVTVIGDELPESATDSDADKPENATDSNANKPENATDSNAKNPDEVIDNDKVKPDKATDSDIIKPDKSNTNTTTESSTGQTGNVISRNITQEKPVEILIEDKSEEVNIIEKENTIHITNIRAPKTADTKMDDITVYILLGSLSFVIWGYLIIKHRYDNE